MVEEINRIFGKEGRSYLMGLAIMWIVFFHIYMWCDISGVYTPRWIKLFDRGGCGVDIFILLSTYGLQASIEKNSIGRFYVNRIKRLFPVYFLFLLTLFLTFEHNCPLDRIIVQIVGQITGLSLFKYPDFFSCGFCFDWFTPAIIFLYILFPLLSKCVQYIVKKGLKYESLILLLVVVLGVIIRENKHFPFTLFAIRFPIVFIGIATNIHAQKGEKHHIIFLCVMAASMGLLSGNLEMSFSLIILPLLLSFAQTEFKLPFKWYVCLVGRHSFEVYLAHIFAVAFFVPSNAELNFYLLSFVTLASTIVIASLYSYVQVKFHSLF